MAVKDISSKDGLNNEILICPTCGWSGTFMQGSVYHHDEMMDSSCPVCTPSPLLATAILTFPSLEEMAANFDNLSEFDKAQVTSRKQFVAEFAARCLRSADQLPDIAAAEITLSWDFTGEGEGPGCKQTVIRHGQQVVWSEPAVWEGYERFPAVLSILKEKYGERLVDVVPTEASGLYLYGDRFGADAVVKEARRKIYRTAKADDNIPD